MATVDACCDSGKAEDLKSFAVKKDRVKSINDSDSLASTEATTISNSSSGNLDDDDDTLNKRKAEVVVATNLVDDPALTAENKRLKSDSSTTGNTKKKEVKAGQKFPLGTKILRVSIIAIIYKSRPALQLFLIDGCRGILLLVF